MEKRTANPSNGNSADQVRSVDWIGNIGPFFLIGSVGKWPDRI